MDWNDIEIRNRTINEHTGRTELTAFHPAVGQVQLTLSARPMTPTEELALIAHKMQSVVAMHEALNHE